MVTDRLAVTHDESSGSPFEDLLRGALERRSAGSAEPSNNREYLQFPVQSEEAIAHSGWKRHSCIRRPVRQKIRDDQRLRRLVEEDGFVERQQAGQCDMRHVIKPRRPGRSVKPAVNEVSVLPLQKARTPKRGLWIERSIVVQIQVVKPIGSHNLRYGPNQRDVAHEIACGPARRVQKKIAVTETNDRHYMRKPYPHEANRCRCRPYRIRERAQLPITERRWIVHRSNGAADAGSVPLD